MNTTQTGNGGFVLIHLCFQINHLHEVVTPGVDGQIALCQFRRNGVTALHSNIRPCCFTPFLRNGDSHVQLVHSVHNHHSIGDNHGFLAVTLCNRNIGITEVFQCPNVIQLLVVLDNICPQGQTARIVIRNSAHVTGVEDHRNVIGNLVTDTHGLIVLEHIAASVGNRHHAVDVFQHTHVRTNLMKHPFTSVQTTFQLRLGEIGVDGELTIILLVLVALVDRTTSKTPVAQ